MTTTIVTILMFLVMISLHEFGHYIFGKLLGFTVLEYAIGFGPAVFKKQKGDTLYSVRIIPFGGFCKFAGEDDENKAEKGNFNEQACWKRILVLMAGAVFNIILGFILFCFIVSAGKTVYTNTIDKVVEGSYLAELDIKAGDEIIELNGKKIGMYQDIQLYTSNLNDGDMIDMKIKRGDEKINLNFKPSRQLIKITYTDEKILYEETLNGISKTSEITYSDQYPKNESLVGKTEESDRYLIGFQPLVENVNASNLLPQSYRMTKFVVKLLYKTVWELITGRASMDQVSGPVGVVREVNNAVHSGSQSVLYVLNLVALLTINLGVFNLLPLPALDGGRLLFVIIEWLRGKPVSPEKEGLVHTIGFIILFAFMLFVSYKDIIKLLS
ncbi:MAG: site-2 protease family protein [Clostridia bacterium]|nr:site-2 protease family protein [Clostridia bacterium]